MGRIQSSIGLITGTDIVGTVDQLIALSGQPRDRLIGRTNTLQREQQAIAELTASVIGVQFSGNLLANSSTFHSRTAESSDSAALSAVVGSGASPASHLIRTLNTAATHSINSLQRFSSADEALGYGGKLSISPGGGFIDGSAELAGLNGGRGVEAGTIRITDRSGTSSDIDLSAARSINDVIDAINDAEVDIRATTVGNAIQLTDESGGTQSNLKVEQLGTAETAADLGIWGIDTTSTIVTGSELELPAGVTALRGTALSELNGGSGIGPLTDLEITLSDGSSATIDLSTATTTSEIIDAIDNAGLSLIVGLNDARNGIRIRDVSGGTGNLTITSADTTAAELGIEASTTDDIVVGTNLNRQTVTADTLLADLNQGSGIGGGSFTITDGADAIGAVNLTAEEIKTVGELVDAINDLGISVTASLNDAGDGIAIVDTSGGTTLTIADVGSGTVAANLGIAGTASDQTVHGSLESAIVGTQAGVITVEADDTLDSLAEKINESGRYAGASVNLNDDGTYSLSIRSNQGGEAGRIAVNTAGFEFDFRTERRGEDALIAVSTDGGAEKLLTSSDGVFNLGQSGSVTPTVTSATLLDDIAGGADSGSFTITDSNGVTSAINITVQEITTVGELVDAINNLGIGVSASINEAGTGISVIDTAEGSETLTISDVGNGRSAASLGLAGKASTQTIGGNSVAALVGPAATDSSSDTSGLVLTLKELSDSPITVTVEEDTDAIVSAAESFVSQYNLLVDKLDSVTFFNADTEEVGLLFGSSEALWISNGYSRLLSGRISGAGDIRSIGQVGIRFDDQGKLKFDQGKLREAIESNSSDVEDFFTTNETGLSDRLNNLADRLAGETSGLLINRTETLSSQIDFNNSRIENFNSRLERERERLLKQFYSTEEAIAKIQSNQIAIDQIQPITIPT